MVVSTIKSVGVTALESNDHSLVRSSGTLKTLIDQDVVPTTSTDEAGDVFLFGPIPSDAIIVDFTILSDDLESSGDSNTVNVGLFYSGIGGNQDKRGVGTGEDIGSKASGTVIDADCFASAITTFQSANITYTSVRFEAANITTVSQPAWQVAGLSEDPGGYFYVGMTAVTISGTEGEGDVVARIDYI